jgi:hypothetical protein
VARPEGLEPQLSDPWSGARDAVVVISTFGVVRGSTNNAINRTQRICRAPVPDRDEPIAIAEVPTASLSSEADGM